MKIWLKDGKIINREKLKIDIKSLFQLGYPIKKVFPRFLETFSSFRSGVTRRIGASMVGAPIALYGFTRGLSGRVAILAPRERHHLQISLHLDPSRPGHVCHTNWILTSFNDMVMPGQVVDRTQASCHHRLRLFPAPGRFFPSDPAHLGSALVLAIANSNFILYTLEPIIYRITLQRYKGRPSGVKENSFSIIFIIVIVIVIVIINWTKKPTAGTNISITPLYIYAKNKLCKLFRRVSYSFHISTLDMVRMRYITADIIYTYINAERRL